MSSSFSGRIFRTRGGALLAGIVAAVLAAILLIVYLKSYRSSVNSGKQPETVLVAKKLIPQGTPGALIGRQGLDQVTTVRRDQLEPLAIANPGTLSGQIAAHDIFPGAQLTSADFTTAGAGELQYQLVGRQRAIAIPVDAIHGLVGQLVAGDNVDVYVDLVPTGGDEGGGGGSLVKLLASDIHLLVAPGVSEGGTGTSGNGATSGAVLRLNSSQVPVFAWAADNARLWLVLRPQVGASKTLPRTVTLETLLVTRG